MEKNVIERALLCSLFLDQVAILEVVGLLRPEMFSDPDHGFIYEVFTDLFNRNKRPDLILVEEEMKKKDPERYLKMGGIAYLSDGMETVRLEYNAGLYAQTVCTKSIGMPAIRYGLPESDRRLRARFTAFANG